MTETISALYDDREAANRAREALQKIGVKNNEIHIIAQSSEPGVTHSDKEDKGFFEKIAGFFFPDDDRQSYEEGVSRGGFLVTAQIEPAQRMQAVEAVERTNPVDLDSRRQQWEAAGWSRQAQTSTPTTAVPATNSVQADAERPIPIVEEQVRIGKREVDRGVVRVHAYVVEQPVTERVALREEHVDVERRPLSQALDRDAAANLLKEQTIELTERGEEVVVGKEAVAREEVVIRKRADERIEEVHEIERRTEVDIDDNRDAGSATSTPRRAKDAR